MTAPPSTHKATLELGEAVVGKTVRWASATLITSADPQSEGGCLRRVWYERVGGKPRITTAAMTAGSGMHNEIEVYLKTGVAAMSPTVMAGRGFIPQPGPGLFIEQSIAKLGLKAAGIPIAGHIDLLNTRGNYIDADAQLRQDLPNTIEVKDWKSTSDLKWAKTAEQVASTIQMNTYGSAVLTAWPTVERVRMTHVYFQRGSRPAAKLATSIRTREQIESRWKYAESVVRSVLDAVQETDPNKVPGNARACRSYNQDCPHKAYCSVGSHNSLDDLYSKIAKDSMGLLSNMPMAPIPMAPNQAVQPAPQEPVRDFAAELAAEEAKLRAQQVQVQQVGAPAPMGLRDVWQRIQAHQRGTPSLEGAAAQALAQACGLQMGPGATMAGSGTLAPIRLNDPAHLYQLCGELEGNPSMYALPSAQVPVQVVAPPQYQVPPPVSPVQSGGLLAADAPSSNPAFASAGAPEATPQYTLPTEEPKRGRGRPKKAPETTSDTAPPAPIAAAPAQAASPVAPPPAGAVSTSPTLAATNVGFAVYVNCRPLTPTQSLHPYVDFLNEQLSKRYCVGGIQDLRCAPKDSPLAYGGWKGAVHEIARTNPPGDGAYHIDTDSNELAEIVADAMRVVCDNRGATYVKAVR